MCFHTRTVYVFNMYNLYTFVRGVVEIKTFFLDVFKNSKNGDKINENTMGKYPFDEFIAKRNAHVELTWQ